MAGLPSQLRGLHAGSGQQLHDNNTPCSLFEYSSTTSHLVQLAVASRPCIHLHNLTLLHLLLLSLFFGCLSLFLINCFLSSLSSTYDCLWGGFRDPSSADRDEKSSLRPIAARHTSQTPVYTAKYHLASVHSLLLSEYDSLSYNTHTTALLAHTSHR